MNDFIRARTDSQKQVRMAEIKAAAASLFKEMPYSDITLTTISSKLGWSRANLYKYITTKEEIFLEITEDEMQKYFDALNAAFPEGNKYSSSVVAEVWAGILNANQEYLKYTSILTSIIEKNVSVDRLAVFKKKYYDSALTFTKRLSDMLRISEEEAYKGFINILYFAGAVASSCEKNLLIQKALEKINITAPQTDFYDELKDFILMEISWRCGRR